VNEGDILKKDITVTNSGADALELNVRASCECITLSTTSFSLKPKTSGKLIVTFDTKGSSLKKTEYLFFDSNDPDNESFSWIIEGDVISKNSVNSSPPIQNVSKILTGPQDIEVYSTKNCSYCLELKNILLPRLLSESGKKANIVFYPLEIPANYKRFVFIEGKLNEKYNELPAVLINGKILGGRKTIEKDLKYEISKVNGNPTADKISFDESMANDEIADKISALKIIPIFAAAFLDGINPCAFAGIVFLVAYLGMIQKKKMMEIVVTGILYIFAVFIVYFFIGMGLINILDFFMKFRGFTKIVYMSAGILTFVLAVLSFYDYYKLSCSTNSSSSDVTLQLPKSIKILMNRITNKLSSSAFFIPFGFFLGAIVSVLEFLCTGQVYLPTIIYMLKVPSLKLRAAMFLSVYSLFFVIPLVVIFVTLLLTINTGRIQAMDKKYVKLIKLFTGLLFLTFSAIIFIS
jgi:hypothetical protein